MMIQKEAGLDVHEPANGGVLDPWLRTLRFFGSRISKAGPWVDLAVRWAPA